MNKLNPGTLALPATSDGYVIVPRADYETIEKLQDENDRLQLDLARLRSGDSENFPLDVVKDLSAGINPVRVIRKWRGMSGKDLAQKCDLSASYISDIENGKTDGSLRTIHAIATALSVDLDDIADWMVSSDRQ